jgi:MFS family permease
MAVFVAARSVAWLFAARAVQGVATGVVLSAASAALLDLHPRGDARRVALVNGVLSFGSLGVGAFVSALLVQWAPAPRVLPFAVVAASLLVLLGLLGVLPEPVARRSGARLRPARPAVPAAIRGPFALAALLAGATFSLTGVYLALGPQLATELLDAHGALAGGAAAAALLVPAALVQIPGRDLPDRTLTAAGGAILTLGGALLALAAGLRDTAPFFASTVLAAVGLGLGVMGALRHFSAVIPPDRRAEVMAAFYVVGYLALSLPAVAAGFAARSLGLADTFALFAVLVVLVAAAVTIGGLRITAERVPSAQWDAGT